MVTLNDYLYNGDTVLKIIQKYSRNLQEESVRTRINIQQLDCAWGAILLGHTFYE